MEKTPYIVFPMLGEGSRFVTAGYTTPKYLLEYKGKRMLEHAVDTLGVTGELIFIVRGDHYVNWTKEIDSLVRKYQAHLLVVNRKTQGAAETASLVRRVVEDFTRPLITVNADQYMHWDGKKFEELLALDPESSYIVTHTDSSPKCSYVRVEEGKIVEVREKVVISNTATVGIYHWSSTQDFLEDVDRMMEEGVKDNNEYYIAPVYNYTIKRGREVKMYYIPPGQFYPVGTPEDFEYFKNLEL